MELLQQHHCGWAARQQFHDEGEGGQILPKGSGYRAGRSRGAAAKITRGAWRTGPHTFELAEGWHNGPNSPKSDRVAEISGLEQPSRLLSALPPPAAPRASKVSRGHRTNRTR
jgi:hypothetical protein